MRTAEEIAKKYAHAGYINLKGTIEAINEARKEAIEAAWELAVLGNGEKILSLINELK